MNFRAKLPFSVEAEQVLVKFALLDDGLEHQVSALTASNIAGLSSPGPLGTAIGSLALEFTSGDERESSTLFAFVNILGLDDLPVALFFALFELGDQFGPVTDHVLGQLVDLVSHFADAIDTLFLGDPIPVGLGLRNL